MPPAVLDNDAKAFALGEARFGAGRGSRCLLGMIVSTGVGGGIVLDGRLLHGTSGNAGHIGHVTVAADGPLCPCGAHGCVTAYASGTGLAARARSEEHTSELQSRRDLVCRLLLEKKKK